MNHDLNTRILWSKAGISGAALGIGSGIFIFIGQAAGNIGSPVAATALSFVLWAIKFTGCIWLMRFFMKRLCAEYGDATNAETFRFGMATALFSALIYSAVNLANIMFVSPDLFAAQMQEIMSSYSSMLDSNSMSMLEKMEEDYPQISFFSTLIYCFLYGTVLSAILSRNIPSRDPFANFEK